MGSKVGGPTRKGEGIRSVVETRLRPRADSLLAVFLFATVAILSALPILRLVMAALAPGGVLDIGAMVERLNHPAVFRAAAHTIDTAACGALAAFIVGSLFAVLIAFTNVAGRKALGFLVLLPQVVAPQVTALAWLHLVGPSSVLLNALHLAPPPGTGNPLYGRFGIILLYGVQNAPIVFVLVRTGLTRLPRDLIEAARMSGASPIRALFTIALPLARPFLVAAFALAFVSGVGNFGIAALAGLPVNYLTLATLIYQRLASYGPDVLPEAAALSVLVALVALAGVALQSLALGKADHRTAPGAPISLPLRRWRVLATILAWTAIAVMLFLPAAALTATALVPAFGVPLSPATVTLSNFAEVLVRQGSTVRAFGNSLLLAGSAGLILGLAAIPLSLALLRRPPVWLRIIGAMVELPYALPGVVIAIACILLFLRPLPLIGSLYGSFAIILIAYLMRFLAFAMRPVTAAIGQIPVDLDEAAAMSGAATARRLATITAPLAAPAAVAGMLLVFLTAFNELTVSALLWSSGHETIGVVLFSLEDAGLGTEAAAIGVTTIAVVVAVLVLVDRLGRRLAPGVLPWR